MLVNNTHLNNINLPVRKITAKVELYNGSTLVDTYKYDGNLIEFNVERIGVGKFFGYGVCQKLNVKLIDVNRVINITTDNSMKVYFDDLTNFPTFFVSEVHRDENTNELSITAYDGIKKAAQHTISELGLTPPYTLGSLTTEIAVFLGFNELEYTNFSFALDFPNGANFDGSETLREVLDAVAEATQAIYFANAGGFLVFKRFSITGAALYTIDKDKYISLDSRTNRRLATIVHATELGDNVSVSTTATGSTQYVRNNPFWDLKDNIGTLLDNALAAVGGLTINQFDCSWRGNYLLEIGDKIELITKDGNSVTSYLLNDTITYNGFLSEQTEWSYEDNEEETASNPSTLGEALKQTYARVDKANKQIELVASDVNANSEAISSLQINTESITSSVQKIESNTNEALENLNGDIATLTSKVEATITAEDVSLQISSALDNGIDKVTTSTGFTFNEEGLTVSKSGTEMTTTITEDGMTVYRDAEAVLTANNKGVNAANLHATTYLIIGTNSRFEDYGSNRTGCFWIGG